MVKSVSEYDIAKLLAEKPQKLDSSFSQLNLRFIKDPEQSQEELSPEEQAHSNKRKVVRLVYLIWSGLTKYLRNNVCFKHKAVEVQPLGIFAPVPSHQARDPLFKGPLKHPSTMLPQPVLMILNEAFVSQLGTIQLDRTSPKAVGSFNPLDRSEVTALFDHITALNLASMASACKTDP